MTTPPPPAIQLPAPRLSAPMALPESFTVLVVDDQRSVRAALKAELQHAGVADIMEAGTAEEALAQFKARRPDLVLLDIKLPGRDGYWAAQQMREAEPGDWTPIIFLSGLDSDLDLWRGIEAVVGGISAATNTWWRNRARTAAHGTAGGTGAVTSWTSRLSGPV